MKKKLPLFLCLPLLTTSCTAEREHAQSLVSAVSSQMSLPSDCSVIKSSYDFGDDPTSIYEREESELIGGQQGQFVVHALHEENDAADGVEIACKNANAWANVKVVGDQCFTAGVWKSGMLWTPRAYDDYENGALLEGRQFKGMSGDLPFYVYIKEKACRNPSEAFVRITFVAKDNLEAITGYGLAVVYPTGEPVDANDPDNHVVYPDVEEREPGPVWLYWKSECVYAGVRFPKIEGLYQRIDPDRVEAALDIMVEKAKGHYFTKES